MRIGLITYERGHLKTEQVATGLAALGRHTLEFHALPFNPRPGRTPLFDHRPDQFAGCAPTADLARRLGARFTPCASEAEILAGGPSAPDIWMVMIGVLLSADFLARAKVINCHAGIVPSVRGLDAFKWAILDDQPLGVTLHYVDAEVDAGEVIAVVPTDVRPNDTIADLARRHYDNEIDASIAFETHVAGRTNPSTDMAARPPRMRMNNEIWLAQTPQMSRLGVLHAALAATAAQDFAGVTDEASAMEMAGHRPLLVPGSARNFKITYPDDFALAEAIFRSRA